MEGCDIPDILPDILFDKYESYVESENHELYFRAPQLFSQRYDKLHLNF